MKVLMISTDRKIFERDSAVRQRVVQYGSLVEELHIIVFNSKKEANSKSLQPTAFSLQQRISGSNVTLYPTNSKNRWFYIYDAIKIGRRVIRNSKIPARRSFSEGGEIKNSSDFLITTQDPFETGLVGWIIAKLTKSKLQIQVHTDFMNRSFRMESFLNNSRSRMALFLVTQADGIRVVSERIEKQLTAYSQQLMAKTTTLPIFVNIKKYEDEEASFDLHKKYPQFNFIILMVARLEKEKNIPLAINVMSEIVKDNSKVGLVIVGDGSERKKLELLAVSCGLSAHIIFEGWQDNLVSYYKTANLFMFTSNYEGYGLALVEAAASGCPIITTDVGVAGNLLNKESVKMCKVGDKKCFVEGILDLKKNGLALYDMSAKARKRIEENVIKDKQEYLNKMKEGWEGCFK